MTNKLAQQRALTTVLAASIPMVTVAQSSGASVAGMIGGGTGHGMMGGYWNTASSLDGPRHALRSPQGRNRHGRTTPTRWSVPGQQMQTQHQTTFEAMGTASWQERRNQMNSMFQSRQQASDSVHEAAIKLVAALDRAQKARARQILPGLAYGHVMLIR